MGIGLLLCACTDDLDQMPVTETTSNDVYSEAANYKMVLAKIYASYVLAGQGQGGDNGDLTTINGQDFSRGYFNLQEAATDEVANTWLSGNNLVDLTYINWSAKDSWVSDTYYWLFFNIALCNEFLRNCSDEAISKFSSSEQEEIRAYKSEARFMRAFSYWMVLDLYRKGPKVDENTPVTGFIPEAYDGISLFDFVESELRELVSEGSSSLSDTNEYGRASKPTALALLARLYLNSAVYRGSVDTKYYTECITACHKVISNPAYYLEPDYAKLFNADNHKRSHEILFAMVCDATTSVTWGSHESRRGAMKVKGPARGPEVGSRGLSSPPRAHHRPVSPAAPGRWSTSVRVRTRKMVNYAWAGRSQRKLWWRSVAVLTCKSVVRPGYRGERLIEPSSSWFPPKFPSG